MEIQRSTVINLSRAELLEAVSAYILANDPDKYSSYKSLRDLGCAIAMECSPNNGILVQWGELQDTLQEEPSKIQSNDSNLA